MVYERDQNYLNTFLHVVNTVLLPLASIDWQALEEVAYQKAKGNKKLHHKFKDFGTT
jgi:hypothetical protein